MTATPKQLTRNVLMLVAALAVIAGVAVVASSKSHSVGSHRTIVKAHAARSEHGPLAIAAHYIGLSRPELHRALRADGTLAAVAASAHGRSTTGLIEAMVRARKARLRAALAAGTITKAQQSRAMLKLRQQVSAQVRRVHGKRS